MSSIEQYLPKLPEFKLNTPRNLFWNFVYLTSLSALMVGAVSCSPITAQAETQRLQGQEVRKSEETTSYTPSEIKFLSSGSMIEKAVLPDGSTHILARTNGELLDLGRFDFAVYGVAMSPKTPNVIVVAGSTAASGQGFNTSEIRFTLNGGRSWSKVSYNGGRMWDVQIEPEGKFAWLTDGTNTVSNKGHLIKLDLTTGYTSDYPFDHDYGKFNMTGLSSIFYDTNGNLKLYGTVNTSGFYEVNLGQTVTVQHLDKTSSKPSDKVMYFSKDGQPQALYFYNGDNGTTPNNTSRRTGKAFIHTSQGLTSFEVNTSLYPEATQDNSIEISAITVDTTNNKGYIGVRIIGTNNSHQSFVEVFDLSDPTNFNKRFRLPVNSVFPTFSPNDVIDINSIGIVNNKVVVGINKSQLVSGQSLPVFVEGFTAIYDQSVWNKIAVANQGTLGYALYLPFGPKT